MLSMRFFSFVYFYINRRAEKSVFFPQAVGNKADIRKMEVFFRPDPLLEFWRVIFYLLEFVDMGFFYASALGRPMNLYDF